MRPLSRRAFFALGLAGPRVSRAAAPKTGLVVGAGISGPAAARALTDRGDRAAVLAARDRLGGRAGGAGRPRLARRR